MLRTRLLALLACCVIAPLALGGCQDQTAARQAELQKKIAAATAELAEADLTLAAADENAVEEARRALERIISDLGQANEGTKGQQAAAALLTATAHRRLASINLNRAAELEAAHADERMVLREQVDAALRLETLAAGRSAVGTESERQFLEGQRDVARQRLSDYSERLAELDGPITTREQQNRDDKETVAELEREARDLRRQANELGPADGFEKFQTAIDLERQADSREMEIGIRDIALQLELKPEHELASAQVDHLQNMLEEIRATEQLLNENEQLTNEQIRDTRQVAAQFSDEIGQALGDLDERSTNELEQIYAEAIQHLDRALSDAQRAVASSTNDSREAARLAVARIHELTGRIYLTKSRGLIDQEETLQQAQTLLPRLPVPVSDVEARREQAIESAREAFDKAQESLQSLGSGGSNRDETAALQRSVEVSLASLEGRTVEPMLSLSSPALTLGSGGGTRYQHNPTGASSPQEIADALKSLDGLDDARTVINYVPPIDRIPALQPMERALLETGLGTVVNLADLNQALSEKFGRGLAELAKQIAPAEGAGGMPAMGGMPNPSQMPKITGVQIGATEGDRSVLLLAIAMGEQPMPLTLPLRQTNGRWFFDINEQLVNTLKQLSPGGGMGAPPGGQLSAEDQAMADRMAQAMLSGMVDTVNTVINPTIQELTANVQSGQYPDADAFVADVQQRIQQFMEQMFGGFDMGEMDAGGFEMPEGMEGFQTPPGSPEK